jgi:hypothetical protein
LTANGIAGGLAGEKVDCAVAIQLHSNKEVMLPKNFMIVSDTRCVYIKKFLTHAGDEHFL